MRTKRSHEPPMDQSAFLANFEGMEDLARELIQSFLQNSPKMLEALEAAARSGSPQQLELAAHTLKGACAHFFAEPAQRLCGKIEKLAHEEQAGECAIAVEKFKAEYAALKRELRKLLNQHLAA